MAKQYNSILKATSIFGGTQIIQLLINFARSKFIALLIGPVGIGLTTMYNSTLSFIITLFGLGINVSVVRDLTKAYDEGDLNKVALYIGIFKKTLLVLSFLGVLSVIIMSNSLSVWSFGDNQHGFHYSLLSINILFTLLQQGNTALLISLRRIKDVAKCSVYTSIVTLLTSVPLFYFWGVEGIVPGLIISTFASYIISWIFVRKIELPEVSVQTCDIYNYGKELIHLGVAMVGAQLMGNLSIYLINIGVSNLGGIDDLGLYSAANTITIQSVSLVFSAMASDYYPRLTMSLKDLKLMNETVNQQSEIVLFLATPVLCAIIFFAPLIIKILFSDSFLIIVPILRFLCVSMLCKAACYSLGYISFAKGDKYIFFFLEGIYGNIIVVFLALIFYWRWGLIGLSVSYIVNYIQYFFLINVIDTKRYSFKLERSVAILSFTSFLVVLVMALLPYALDGISFYIIEGCILFSVVLYYTWLLDKKTNIIQTIKSRLKL